MKCSKLANFLNKNFPGLKSVMKIMSDHEEKDTGPCTSRQATNKEKTYKQIVQYIEDLKFDTDIDYAVQLEAMRSEFDRAWENSEPSPKIGLMDFKKLRKLQSGSFGSVYLVEQINTGNNFAVKEMSKRHVIVNNYLEGVLYEKKIMQSAKFPFILPLLFSRKDNNFLYLGMPYIGSGTLFDVLQREASLTEDHARFYGMQVCLALEYLHQMEILYRDLKPENVMIEENGYLKLIDFGFCKRVLYLTDAVCGTKDYMPPEMVNKRLYNRSVDWWSYGVFLFELVKGDVPFSDDDAIIAGDFKMPQEFSSKFQSLIKGLLVVDPARRLGCNSKKGSEEIKTHNWFEGHNWYSILNKEVKVPYIPYMTNTLEPRAFVPDETGPHYDSSDDEFADF